MLFMTMNLTFLLTPENIHKSLLKGLTPTEIRGIIKYRKKEDRSMIDYNNPPLNEKESARIYLEEAVKAFGYIPKVKEKKKKVNDLGLINYYDRFEDKVIRL